jgi:hypothetical protein
VDTSLETGKPEFKVFIDRDKAADLGINIATIAEAVNLLFGGEVDVTKFKVEKKGRRYDVRARLNPEDRVNPEDVGKIHVRSRDGRLVELSNVIRVVEGGGPSVINRVDRQRAVTVYANLEKKPMGQAMAELDAITAGVLPSDFTAVYKGQASVMQESFQYSSCLPSSSASSWPTWSSPPSSRASSTPSRCCSRCPCPSWGVRGPDAHGKNAQCLQLHRADPAHGARQEERHPARGLHQHAACRGVARREAIHWRRGP